MQMDTLTLKTTLTYLWPLLYAATYRPVSETELSEIRRLADLLKDNASIRLSLDTKAEELSLAIYSSGLFEANRDISRLDAVLDKLDELRELLISADGF